MDQTVLHITNGSNLTEYLKELDIQGHFLSWQEMLCEGPTKAKIDSDEFFEIRRQFLSEYYEIDIDKNAFKEEIRVLNDVSNYSEIVLWFEYDLFCHINLLGVLALLKEKKITLPLYLVCSGRIPEEKGLKGLGELTPAQLLDHYKNKIKLTEKDISLAYDIWLLYCGKDHNLLKPYIVQSSSFKYLSNCLKAHLKRFPDSRNGLNAIEENILILLRDNRIKSKHHLLGYALNYQGYYGFGDMQLNRTIENLSLFFTETEEGLTLNRNGHEALLKHYNFASDINNGITFGGVRRLDYQFSKSKNKLIKTIINAY